MIISIFVLNDKSPSSC